MADIAPWSDLIGRLSAGADFLLYGGPVRGEPSLVRGEIR